MSAPTPEAVIHLATLHTLAQAGFASTSKAASITLSTVIPKYLKVLATACVERASLAGRGKVAAIDVVDALDDLGINVDELIDWGSEQNGDYFDDASMGNLQEYLQEGLSVEEGIAQMKLVPQEELDQEEDDEDTNEQDEKPEDEDVMMEQEQDQGQQQNVKLEPDIDAADEVEERPYIYRHKSPDFSWLPPLPSTSTIPLPPPQPTATEDPNQPISETASLPALSQSIADRYRRPISYASSQLSQAHPFHDPPHPPSSLPLPPAPTSLPSLISTYAAIASDPSVALRQTDLRRQATELLRQSISTVDSYSPQPTLTTSIPPVRGSSIVPSHSDILPQKLLPVNPNSVDGLLSSLVHQITSPNLPYTLRERLTSLRPPVVQSRNDTPIFYNDAVKGPDDNALLKFKGKHTTSNNANNEDGGEGEGGGKEVWLKQTWDSGPRGLDKWSRPFLPKGKKVIIQREGEKKPRMSDEDVRRIQQEEEERRVLAEKEKEREGKVKVNLRLPSFTGNGNANGIESSGGPSNPLGSVSPNPLTSSGTTPTPGIGIKLKLGGAVTTTPKLSISPGPPNPQVANNQYPYSVNPYN